MFAPAPFRRPFAALVLMSLLLTGCAAGPGVLFARAALDGVSLVATGKTSNGLGLSAVTGEDCEPMRALQHELVCRPDNYPDSDARLSHATREPNQTAFGGVFADAAQNDVMIEPIMLPEFTEIEAPEPYVVIASFREPVDARAAAWHLADLPAVTSATMINGIRYHRVIVGPLNPDLEEVLAKRLANAGVLSFYPVLLCPEDQSEPPCISKPRYRPIIDPDRVAAVAPR